MFLEDELDSMLDGVAPVQPVPPMNPTDTVIPPSSSSAGIIVEQPLEDENDIGFLESTLQASLETTQQILASNSLSSGSVDNPSTPAQPGENDDTPSVTDPASSNPPSSGSVDNPSTPAQPGENDDTPSVTDPASSNPPSSGSADNPSTPAQPGEDDDTPSVTDPASSNPPSSGSVDNPSTPAQPGEDDDTPSVTDPASSNPPSSGSADNPSTPAQPGEDDDTPSVTDPASSNPPSSGSADNPSTPAQPGEDDHTPSDSLDSQTLSPTNSSDVVNVGPGAVFVDALAGDDVINLSAINSNQPMQILGGEGSDQFIFDSTFTPSTNYFLNIIGGAGQDTIDLSRVNSGSFSAIFSDGQAAIPLQNLSSSSSPTNIFNVSASQGVIQMNQGGTVTTISFTGVEKIIV